MPVRGFKNFSGRAFGAATLAGAGVGLYAGHRKNRKAAAEGDGLDGKQKVQNLAKTGLYGAAAGAGLGLAINATVPGTKQSAYSAAKSRVTDAYERWTVGDEPSPARGAERRREPPPAAERRREPPPASTTVLPAAIAEQANNWLGLQVVDAEALHGADGLLLQSPDKQTRMLVRIGEWGAYGAHLPPSGQEPMKAPTFWGLHGNDAYGLRTLLESALRSGLSEPVAARCQQILNRLPRL